ncbi:NF038120 family PEP-CTERM protein [Rugamonas sp. A1-17]|nr:NF038120 family PEP-CTERM protein [Rugamonas sp. A1-17]
MQCDFFSAAQLPLPRALSRWTTAALAITLAMTVLPAAHADTTIDFNNLVGAPMYNGETAYVNNGFYIENFSNAPSPQPGDYVGMIVDDGANQCAQSLQCPVTSTPYLAAVNDSVMYATRDQDHQSFLIKSFQAAFLGPVDPTNPSVTGLLAIEAHTASGAYQTATFGLGAPGANGFEFANYTTTGAFSNTLFTSFYVYGYACNAGGSCTAFNSDRGQFAIDNILTSAVPEPASWMMFGAGLLGLAAATRRRQA